MRHHWKSLAAAAGATFLATSAQAEWRKYETDHFVIYSEQKPKVVEELATELEKIDGLMRLATGLQENVIPAKVRIYQVSNTNVIDKAIGQSNTGIAGFYNTNSLGPFAVTPRRVDSGDSKFTPELVLRHEYAHHFMLQYFPATYPSWYVEGFAELIGSSNIMPDGRVAYGQPAKHRGDAIAFTWVPLREVFLTPPHKLRYFDTYGQGWAMTHFLTFSDERSPQLRRYLAALSSGRPPEEAVRAFGDLDDLSREAFIYLKNGRFSYRPVDVSISQPLFKRVERLSAGEADTILETIGFNDDDLSLYRKESTREREEDRRRRHMEDLRRKAAQYPNDPYVHYLLSETEFASGNFQAAAAAADRALKLNPRHVRAMVRKSLSLGALAKTLPAVGGKARAAEARALAIQANRTDPNDPLPMLAVYESYRAGGERPPAAAVEALEIAVANLPQDLRVRQILVNEYQSQRRWRDAIVALMPIVSSPHESPRREAARAQLAQLQAELAKQEGRPAES